MVGLLIAFLGANKIIFIFSRHYPKSNTFIGVLYLAGYEGAGIRKIKIYL